MATETKTPKLVEGSMLRNAQTSELWEFCGLVRLGTTKKDFRTKVMLRRYQPSFLQTTVTKEEFVAMPWEITEEIFTRRIHNPPRVPERVETLVGVEHGWCSPGGVLYACGYGNHRALADGICLHLFDIDSEEGRDRADEILEQRGWAKLWTYEYPDHKHPYWTTRNFMRRLTSQQEATAREWCSLNGYDTKRILD